MITGTDFKLRMSVSRNYGAISVGFELEETFAGGGMNEYLAAVDSLNRSLRAIAEHWERTNVAAATQQQQQQQQQQLQQPQPQQQQQQQQQQPQPQKLEGAMIHVFDGMSHRWRFKGGRWQQYGVAVYPEHLPSHLTDDCPLGEQPGRYTAEIITDPSGKPLRAVNVQAVALGF